MSKLSQPVLAQGTTHPPCPGWCEHHWDSNEDARQGVAASGEGAGPPRSP
jgi:hypothetical protein